MVIVDDKQKDREDNEEEACACLHYDENRLMKLLTLYTDKRMKQEIQISSAKARHALVVVKSKEAEEEKKGHFVKIG